MSERPVTEVRPHPGPLPQEREERSAPLDKSTRLDFTRDGNTSTQLLSALRAESPAIGDGQFDSGTAEDARKLFLLPGGKGQGDGERATNRGNLLRSLREHWPEYLIEAWALGTFMISAAVFTSLLNYPGSPIRQAISNDFLRLALNGLAMGLTAIGIIYSPWGQRSGAHMNPAITLTFLRLKKIAPWDALFYVAAQFIGGIGGVLVARLLLGGIIAHPTVNYVVTMPGPAGATVAFVAEATIASGMMWMVLNVTNTPRLARFAGLFGGALVFLYITLESPLSGMSINPARTAASALPSGIWAAGWIYFTAPVLGMFAAAELYRASKGLSHLACPKFHHGTEQRCIFCGLPGARTALSACRPPADHDADSAVRAPTRL